MLDQLLANQGKTIVVELVNGRKISGTLLSATQQYLRLENDEGIGNIPVQAVCIVWEVPAQTLTKENMDEIAGKLRDSVKAHIACTAFPGFTCSQSYICRPPDTCTFNFSCPGSYVPGGGGSQCGMLGGFTCAGTQFYGIVAPGYPMASQYEQDELKAEIACTGFPGFSCTRSYICRPPDTCSFRFACPGSYVPSFPSGGGACPFFACGPFQFGPGCTFQFGCRPFQFGPGCTFQFGCRPFQFGPGCTFQFGCGPLQFACRPFTFGGSQCGAPGGFVCAGQQFFGVASGGGSQCGVPGGFTCAGQQFFGAPVKPPGMTAATPPISPMEFSVKPEDTQDDDKSKKE